MKKFFVVIAFLLLGSIASNAQSPLPVGSSQLNFGVGLSEWGVPLYVGLDYSADKDITVGGEFSFRGYEENWKKKYYRRSIIGISGNVNYHFNSLLHISRKWDFYAGLNLGFYAWSSPPLDYDGNHASGLGLGLQVGGRYYFSNKVGINLELGTGNAFSGGKFGLSIKL